MTGRLQEPAATADRHAGIGVGRGLAILLVVTNHTALRMPWRLRALAACVPRRVAAVFRSCGFGAVFAFLVASGLLIAGTALRRYGVWRGGRLRCGGRRALYRAWV